MSAPTTGGHPTAVPPASTGTRPRPSALPLTGERTVPGVAAENYWFRRHEVVYEHLLERTRDREVLEAGFGEGYGAALIAGVARRVVGVDYDAAAVAHVQARYPAVTAVQGNLVDLPLPAASVDVVVTLQVIEHLWDQARFVTECARVLRRGGLLLMSTPNRLTFSPAGAACNPFHTRELDAAELGELLDGTGFAVQTVLGVHHGPRLRTLDARHGGSVVAAQIALALAGDPWPQALLDDVASVRTADFDVLDAAAGPDIDTSLDLVAVAVRRD